MSKSIYQKLNFQKVLCDQSIYNISIRKHKAGAAELEQLRWGSWPGAAKLGQLSWSSEPGQLS